MRLRRVELRTAQGTQRTPHGGHQESDHVRNLWLRYYAGNYRIAAPPGQSGAAVEVLQDLLAANNQVARHNRAHFGAHGVLAINIMSSPGAGKTALLEATIVALKHRYRIAVIEGDLETDNDAVAFAPMM